MLDFLAEQRLEEAVSRGELANLPGEGRPLELDDDPLIPEDLRAAYRIPQLENLVNQGSEDAAARSRAMRKLALLRTRIENRYYEKIVAKLGR
jgi:Domain of unknown function (DUF1992)